MVLGSEGFVIETDEMLDAQPVDIGIVGDTLPGEVLTEIVAVGAYGLCKLRDGQVVLQIELRVDAMLL